MEAIGFAGTVIGLVTALKDLIELSMKLRDSIEMVKKNKKAHLEIVSEVINTAEDLRDIYETQPSKEVSETLQRSRERLQRKIKIILQKCGDIRPPKRGFMEWYNRNAYDDDIKNIREALTNCYKQETLFGVVEIKKMTEDGNAQRDEDAAHLKGELADIKRLISGLVQEGKKESASSTPLVLTERMTPAQIKSSLRTAKASLKASPSGRSSLSSTRKAYLELKVDVLTAALKRHSYKETTLRPQFIERSSSQSSTHHAQTTDATEETDDAVLTILDLTEALQSSSLQPLEVATKLDVISTALADIGQFHQALQMSREAVTLLKKLRNRSRQVDVFHLSLLARVLHNYCNRLQALGCLEDALDAADEAVSTFHEVVCQDASFYPDYALALNFLANCHDARGDHNLAVQYAVQAVAIYRKLGLKEDLAMALNNLAVKYCSLGLYKDAFQAATESTTAYKTLHQSDSAYASEYATSLATLAKCCNGMGPRQTTKALTAAREALRIRRNLATTRPLVFKPSLASSLYDVGQIYVLLKQFAEACEKRQESVQIYRQLAESDDRYTSSLVSSLRATAACLLTVERPEDALPLLEECIEFYTSPIGSSLQALAELTEDACLCYKQLGDSSSAHGMAVKTTDIRRRIYEKTRSLETAADFARASSALSASYELQKQFRLASDAIQFATKLYDSIRRHSTNGHPFVFEHQLTRTWYKDTSISLEFPAKNLDDAATRALRHLDALRATPRDKAVYEISLEIILNTSKLLTRCERHEEARQVAQVAVEFSRGTAEQKRAYQRLSNCYSDLKLYELARAADASSRAVVL